MGAVSTSNLVSIARCLTALAFWDSRLVAGEVAAQRADFKGELGTIGQWCENHQIESTWIFDRLIKMLRSGFAPTHAYDVVQWLAKACDTDVDRATEVLEALLTNPNIDQWVYVGQDQSIRAILTAGRARGKPVTIKRVEEIVSFLASIGQPGYLDLVRASQSATANQYE